MVDAIPRQDPDPQSAFRPPELPLLVFTDLDGTLLDHHSYSFTAALPALERLRKARVPVIPVTSKTLAELAPLMRELDNAHPCIAENGGLIALPPGYFAALDGYRLEEGYRVIELSANYENLVQTAGRLRADHQYQFRGFSDMSDCQPRQPRAPDAAGAASRCSGWIRPLHSRSSDRRWKPPDCSWSRAAASGT
jgi:mannosyl-3-phosphoglycerate phosphatase